MLILRRNLRHNGFTLIELLAVVVIILILAGIVLGLVKFANEKAARSKAEGEISAISAALESYKTDNGTYPKEVSPTGSADPSAMGATDKLNAQQNYDPTDALYKNASGVLYQAISGDPGGSSNSSSYNKTYYNVPTAMMSSGTGTGQATANGTTSKYLVDPFGNSYGYSTINETNASANNSTDGLGYNPTFDLWCTAGYGPIKLYPAQDKVPDKSVLWIKNW